MAAASELGPAEGPPPSGEMVAAATTGPAKGSLPSGFRASFRDWAPRAHPGLTTHDHMRKMYSVGTPGSSLIYFNPVITGISAGLLWGFVVWAIVAKEDAKEVTADAQAWVTDVWDWFYMASQNVWIVVLVYIMFKYYDLKLGKDSDEPEFSDSTYFAMLFSCGVATGLWYFTNEPMSHYESASARWSDQYMWNNNTRAEHSMMVAFFHWGVHGWIPYTVVGALVSLLSYRRGLPMSMRFTLYPLIGEMCYGVIGDLIEVLSILCTVFGVCTSLGLGAMQINKGLMRLDRGTFRGEDTVGCDNGGRVDAYTCAGRTGLGEGTTEQIAIIVVITLLATASVVAGLKSGIAMLSQIAFGLSAFILLGVLFLDDTWYILNALTSTFGYYLWYLPKISFHTDAWEMLGAGKDGGAPDGRGGKAGWMNGWTIFYWGWWISWGPFVGTFLARISKGRKLGHFIIATLILPSLWSFGFIGIFGAAQIRMTNIAIAVGLDGKLPNTTFGHLGTQMPENAVRLSGLSSENILFEHLASYGGEGWTTFITVVTLVCIVLYFVTSSDSASYVVDIMAANGQEEPPVCQKIFWAFTEGAAAAALLTAGSGALSAVKAIPIILGLPFTFLLFWMCQGLLIVCKEEMGELSMYRRHFTVFLLNAEPNTLLSFVAPFVPLGWTAGKVWGGSDLKWIVGFASMWFAMIALLFLGFVDQAYAHMGAAMFFVFGVAASSLRVATRARLGISGDMLSDACVCCFALPWACGQMAAEKFDGWLDATDGWTVKNADAGDAAEEIGNADAADTSA